MVLSTLAFIGVVVLFGMKMKNGNTPTNSGSSGSAAVTGGSRIAFVNIDTFNANYIYLKSKRMDFEKKQEGMKAEMERSAKQFQNDYLAYQRKVQAGTITQAEAESSQKRLIQMEQSLKTREEALTGQLMEEQDVFNKELKDRLDKYLEEYNKDKKYDYILSYAAGSPIMYANKALDITAEVVKGMNEDASKMSDTEKKNK